MTLSAVEDEILRTSIPFHHLLLAINVLSKALIRVGEKRNCVDHLKYAALPNSHWDCLGFHISCLQNPLYKEIRLSYTYCEYDQEILFPCVSL